MTAKQARLGQRLKQLGFVPDNRMKLYGERFALLTGPIVVEDNLVFIDAIEEKSGRVRRVRIPLPIVHMASGERRVA